MRCAARSFQLWDLKRMSTIYWPNFQSIICQSHTCLVTTATGTERASISFSKFLHKCLLMAEFKLQIFRQENIPAPVVWAEAYKGSNSDQYQQTMTLSIPKFPSTKN